MRYGIFSDIHGNYEALQSVLIALSRERIDKYLCLGDLVGYGADPDECVREIKKINPLTVAGNHDWAIAGLFDLSDFTSLAKEAVLWTGKNINRETKEFLKGLKLVHQEKELTLVHGSLDSPEKFNYIKDIFSARETFQLCRTGICFVAHTHRPAVFIKEKKKYTSGFYTDFKLKDSRRYIINTGSVGQPRDRDPRAAYVVYDSEEKRIEIKRVAYDIRRAQEKIIKAGLPTALAERLAEGR
jgi:diadenosine tetraphosphatase ApaH/serine/threonine PP2A family protein phosphatase